MNKKYTWMMVFLVVGCSEGERSVSLDGSFNDAPPDTNLESAVDLSVNPIFAIQQPSQLEIVASGESASIEYSVTVRLDLPDWAQGELDRELLQSGDVGTDAGPTHASRSQRLRQYLAHWADWLVANPPSLIGASGTIAVVRSDTFPQIALRLTLNPPVQFGARPVSIRVRDHTSNVSLFVRGAPFSLDQTYGDQGILRDFERSNRTVNRCAIATSGAPVFLAGAPPDDTMPNWVRERASLPSVAWFGDAMVQCQDGRLQIYSTQRALWEGLDGMETAVCHVVGNLESGDFVVVSRANPSQSTLSVDVFSQDRRSTRTVLSPVNLQFDAQYPALYHAGSGSRFAVEAIGSANLSSNKSEVHFCDAQARQCTYDVDLGLLDVQGFAYLGVNNAQRVRVRNLNMDSTDPSQRMVVADWTGNQTATLANEVTRLPISAFVGTDGVLRAFTGVAVASINLRERAQQVAAIPAAQLTGVGGPMIKQIVYDGAHNRLYTCHENGQVRRFWL